MAEACRSPVLCKSVFREEREFPTPGSYTKAWIALINQLEKRKEELFSSANDRADVDHA